MNNFNGMVQQQRQQRSPIPLDGVKYMDCMRLLHKSLHKSSIKRPHSLTLLSVLNNIEKYRIKSSLPLKEGLPRVGQQLLK